MTACVSRCLIRGEHNAECDDDTCRGCRPIPAALPALVCDRCVSEARLALTRIPDHVAHIRTMVKPGSPPERSGAKHTKGDSAAAPLNVQAVSDADDLHALVAELTERVMDGRNLRGPDIAGSDIRPAAKRRTTFGAIVYEPARIVGIKDPASTATLVAWLLPHFEWILTRDGAKDVVQDIKAAERAATLRWPVEERPRRLPTPCPACDRLTLTRYAPSHAGLPVTITCTWPDCRHVVPESRYGTYARMVVDSRRLA